MPQIACCDDFVAIYAAQSYRKNHNLPRRTRLFAFFTFCKATEAGPKPASASTQLAEALTKTTFGASKAHPLTLTARSPRADRPASRANRPDRLCYLPSVFAQQRPCVDGQRPRGEAGPDRHCREAATRLSRAVSASNCIGRFNVNFLKRPFCAEFFLLYAGLFSPSAW